MKIIQSSYEILTQLDRTEIMTLLEKVARTCYKSEDKITPDSSDKFIRGIIRSGHEAMIEHYNITVKIICSRGISHELVRHRIASFAQESTRWICYAKEKFNNEITVIEPSMFNTWDNETKLLWQSAMKTAEEYYFRLVDCGLKGQFARGVLPTDLKTELNITCNLREWRTIFKLRAAPDAHPDVRAIMLSLLKDFYTALPAIFEDIWLLYNKKEEKTGQLEMDFGIKNA